MKSKLPIINKAKCLHCNDIIESLNGGHWVCCKCFESSNGETGIYIDTNRKDLTIVRGGGNPEHFKRLTK